MENNKYYTPSTEELRVGLEYETLREMKGGTMVPKEEHIERWSKEIMDKWNLANILTSWPHIIRIKYLDAQDIEELGWEEDTLRSVPGTRRCFNKEHYTLVLFSNHKVIIRNMEYMINPIVFQGTILNKSELIFILKRVGVL